MNESQYLLGKMTGKLKQPDDIRGKRFLHGRFLRTPVATGLIKTMELPEIPQGIVCIRNRNTAGKLKFGSVAMSLFADKEIHWQGEPVLAAAGSDTEEVDDWISRIQMEILPHEKAPEPWVSEQNIHKGSVQELFSRAFQIIEEKMEIPCTPASARQQTVLCVKDGAHYTIHMATSWPTIARHNAAAMLKTEKKNIHIKPSPLSPESSRQIWFPSVTASQAALLSAQAKRSVCICHSSKESRLYTPGFPGGDFHIRGAVDTDGRITAMEIFFTIYAGAFFPLEEEFFHRIVLGLFSIYPCRNYSITGRIEHKALTPSTFGPAAGFELGFLAGESFASRVSEHYPLQPGKWYRESFPVPGQAFGPGINLPKDFPMHTLLHKALATSDYERKRASFEQTQLCKNTCVATPEFHRGIGLSCAWFGNGFTFHKESGTASLSLTLDKEGKLSIDIPFFRHGGTLEHSWINLISTILGVDEKSIRFTDSPVGKNQNPGPSILGCNVSIYTRLLELAGNDLLKRRFRDPLPISITRTKRCSGSRSWNGELLEGSPFETISWGVGIVEVAVSTVTMEIKTTRVWLALDGGYLLAPDIAKSAVESSVEESLKWCQTRKEKRELPMINVQFSETGNKRHCKDVSTLPWLLVPAAFLQATRQASGVRTDRIPVTPEQLATGGGMP